MASEPKVPTCIFPLDNDQLDTSEENIIRNMRRLAEAAAKKNISIGYTLTCLEADVPMCDHVLIAPLHSYEAPAWGIAFNNWQDIDRVIRKIDRPNVKHCIDTFHIGALEWGDPESPDTKFKHADGEARLDGSLSQLKTRLKAEDIGYLQVSTSPQDPPSQSRS